MISLLVSHICLFRDRSTSFVSSSLFWRKVACRTGVIHGPHPKVPAQESIIPSRGNVTQSTNCTFAPFRGSGARHWLGRPSLKRWAALTRFLDDGRLCMTNNAAERELRAVAVGRRNWTFAGSDEGGRRAAALYHSSPPLSSMTSTHKPGSPTCWPACRIIPPGASTNCCPGTGPAERRR